MCTFDEFVPKLTTTNWNDEWMGLQKARHAADNAEHWNERAKTYHKSAVPTPYVKKFLEYADVCPDETVFDMGCGTGAISIPLAQEGHRVIAADFSQGMLDVLKQQASHLGINGIETKLVSWADDWNDFGITENCVDVATASRSIATANLEESLAKLTAVARRRCVITLPTGSSPRTDEGILSAIGIQGYLGRDYLYAMMILVRMGYFPEVLYIPSERFDTFDDASEAFASLKKMVVDAAGSHTPQSEVEQALSNLSSWLDANLVPNPDAGQANEYEEVQKAYRLRNPRKVTWALIRWDTSA